MRAAVARLRVADAPEVVAAVRAAADDLRDAGTVDILDLVESETPDITVELAPTEA